MLAHEKNKKKNTNGDAEPVKFDFGNSRRLSKEQRVGLNTVNESFAKLVAAYFTTLFRVLADVRVIEVQEIPYGEFISSRPDPDCIWTFQMDVSRAFGLIELDPIFANTVIDRLFGGNGDTNYAGKTSTKIEQSLVRRVVERILSMWDQSWLNLIRISSQILSFESKPYLVQIAARNEIIVRIVFDMTISSEKFHLNMCFPVPMFEPLLSSMKDQAWSFLLPKKKNEQDLHKIESALVGTSTQMTALLGSTTIHLHEFMGLEIGDVLVLEQKTKEPLIVKVANRPKYLAFPGVVEKQCAIKISGLMKNEE